VKVMEIVTRSRVVSEARAVMTVYDIDNMNVYVREEKAFSR
jgi:hypothetical protein